VILLGWLLIMAALVVTTVRLVVDRRALNAQASGHETRLSRYWLVASPPSRSVLTAATMATGAILLALGIMFVVIGR
jgi:hypothetical protein